MMLCKNCNSDFDETREYREHKWCPTCRTLARGNDHFELRMRSKHLCKGDYYLKLQENNFCCECCRMPFKLPYESSKNVIIDMSGGKMRLICPRCSGSISHYKKLPDEIKLKYYHIKCVMNYISKYNPKENFESD